MGRSKEEMADRRSERYGKRSDGHVRSDKPFVGLCERLRIFLAIGISNIYFVKKRIDVLDLEAARR